MNEDRVGSPVCVEHWTADQYTLCCMKHLTQSLLGRFTMKDLYCRVYHVVAAHRYHVVIPLTSSRRKGQLDWFQCLLQIILMKTSFVLLNIQPVTDGKFREATAFLWLSHIKQLMFTHHCLGFEPILSSIFCVLDKICL